MRAARDAIARPYAPAYAPVPPYRPAALSPTETARRYPTPMLQDDPVSLDVCPVCGNRAAAHSPDTFTLDDGQRGHVSCTARAMGLPFPENIYDR